MQTQIAFRLSWALGFRSCLESPMKCCPSSALPPMPLIYGFAAMSQDTSLKMVSISGSILVPLILITCFFWAYIYISSLLRLFLSLFDKPYLILLVSIYMASICGSIISLIAWYYLIGKLDILHIYSKIAVCCAACISSRSLLIHMMRWSTSWIEQWGRSSHTTLCWSIYYYWRNQIFGLQVPF